MLHIDPSVKEKYPDLLFGVMVMEQVHNPEINKELNVKKQALEKNLRQQFEGYDRKALKALQPIDKYNQFYKQFKKTYHVQHQLESIVLKNKNLPNVAALVESMFMSEVKNLLLTAGYDFSTVSENVNVKLADGNASFEGIGNRSKTPPQNDILFTDSNSILGSIICGPDHKSRITPQTTKALFVIYGVPGITYTQIKKHLEDIEMNVKVIAPDSYVSHLSIL